MGALRNLLQARESAKVQGRGAQGNPLSGVAKKAKSSVSVSSNVDSSTSGSVLHFRRKYDQLSCSGRVRGPSAKAKGSGQQGP